MKHNEDSIFEAVVSVIGDRDDKNILWDLLIKKVSSHDNLELWRCLNPLDYGGVRHFVVINDPLVIFEVDFLSRHEVSPVSSPDQLPDGWQDWGLARERSILVHDKACFRRKVMTPEIFLALPKHRFESFIDDVSYSSSNIIEAVHDVLSAPVTGYSFIMYGEGSESRVPCLVKTMLEGILYERSNLLRSTLEQCELRPA